MNNFCVRLNKACELLTDEGTCPMCKPEDNIFWEKDVTGAALCPGHPDICQGNGEDPNFECCCDECNYLGKCYDANCK